MKALILERSSVVCRKIERYFRSAGLETVSVADPSLVAGNLEGTSIFGADVFDGDAVQRAVEARPGLRTMLWTAEPMERALRVATADNISNVLARADFESVPRGWELLMVLRRLIRPAEEGPKFAWFLDWGFTGFQERIDTSSTRDRVVQKVERFIEHIGARKKVAEGFSEVTHELLMNAMYGAPIDGRGEPKYARDRKQVLKLPESERPHLKVATDGSRLAIQVTDPFGVLGRSHVFDGLRRGLGGGQMDTSRGGAGLGLTVVHNATSALFFDVVAGVKTEVTALFELDTQHRDFRLQPKSLHFFHR